MLIQDLKDFLEKLDSYRDKLLFLFIKPFWPRFISPNMLSWLRVVISLVMFSFLFFFGITDKTLIVILFVIGILTDLFDGSVARCLNKVTEFGAMLDATADRLIIMPIAIYSLFRINKYLLFALLILEVANMISALFYKSKEIYLESNIFGKTKMVLQSIVFVVILIVWPNNPPQIFVYILWITLIFTILSIFSRTLELKDKGHIKNKILFK